MKEKLGIAFIIIIACLCLFGCKEKMPEEDMVHRTFYEKSICENVG